MNQKSTAPTRNVIAVLAPEAGALTSPCLGAFGGIAADLAAGAGSLRAGGGQVISPFLITVRPRMASSSILTLMTPSLVLHNSSVSRNKLVEYSVDDCLARREVRSV